MDKRSAIWWILLATFMWAMNGVFIRYIDSFSAYGIASGRLLLAAIPFAVWVALKRKTRSEFVDSVSDWKALVLMSFLMAALFVVTATGYQWTYIANAQTFNSIGMFFTILLGPIFLGEKVAKRDIGFMAIAFIGILVVVGIDKINFDPQYLSGDLMSLLGSFVVALYGVAVRKTNVQRPFYIVMLWVFGLGFIWSLLFSLILGQPLVLGSVNTISVLNLVGLSIFGTFLGHTIFNISLKVMRVEKVLTVSVLSAPESYVLGILFFGEWLNPLGFLGLALTIVGVVAVINGQRRL